MTSSSGMRLQTPRPAWRTTVVPISDYHAVASFSGSACRETKSAAHVWISHPSRFYALDGTSCLAGKRAVPALYDTYMQASQEEGLTHMIVLHERTVFMPPVL